MRALTVGVSFCLLAGSASALTPPKLPPGAVVGAKLADETATQLGVSLRLRDEAGLDRFLAELQDPQSPQFHEWITPQTFGERFGPSAADYERTAHWLEAAGFSVKRWPNRIYLSASGNVRAVRRLLAIEPHAVTQNGRVFRTYLGRPVLPADIDGQVQAIAGLDTRRQWHHHIADPSSESGFAFGPQDWRTFYNFTSLASSGSAASGAQLAVIATQYSADGTTAVEPNATEIAAYVALGGGTVPYNPILLPNTNDDFATDPDTNLEYELDVEMQSVAAANASAINVVLAPESTVFTDAPTYIVNTLSTVTAASASLGLCEADLNGEDVSAIETIFKNGLTEGISWFVSSGDSGANACLNDGQGGGTIGVDWPCTLPEVVCVGGTQVSGTPAWSSVTGDLSAYQAESVWNESTICGVENGVTLCEGAGGGGVSTLYAKPSWQDGVSPVDNHRDVPDIAFISATSTPGVALYDDTDGTSALSVVGGTSVAAPLAAGIFTLVSTTIGCRLGDLHPTLYQIGAVQLDGGALTAFHDITAGNNSYSPVTGLSAAPGYDLATGWGSVNVASLISNLTCGSSTTTSGTTSGSSGTTSGTTSSGSSSGTTSGSSGTLGSCTPSTASIGNGDLGSDCTGTGQGSCATGETCEDFLGDGTTRCWATCSAASPGCPGTGICLSTGTATACFPTCEPSVGGCPGGLACYPFTPDRNEYGYCYEACTASSQCNASTATSNVCTSGACACTVNTDCPSGQSCDPGSGACYTPCSAGTCAADTGCCATEGSVDYCDAFGILPSSSTTSSSGTTGGSGAASTTSGGSHTTSGSSGTTSSGTSASAAVGSTTSGAAGTSGATQGVTQGSIGTVGGTTGRSTGVTTGGTNGVSGTSGMSSSGIASGTTGAGANSTTGNAGGSTTSGGASGQGASSGSGSGGVAATGNTTFTSPPASSGGGCSTGGGELSVLPLIGFGFWRRRRK